MRRLPPVESVITIAALLRGAAAAPGSARGAHERLGARLREHFDARKVELLDSGTSALVRAFRALPSRTNGKRARVACPAYVCVDLGAAALRAGVDLALYDSDPATLSPDMDSLSRVAAKGVDAVVVAHLFGFPVALPEIVTFCRGHGIPLIEDSAQEAGAHFAGRRAGSFGDLTILSFGRGKGVTGGGGGALLVRTDAFLKALDDGIQSPKMPAGYRQLILAKAQWILARPSLYWIPLAIPQLQLGEMVYREAQEPHSIARSSAAMLEVSMDHAGAAVATRRANAARLQELVAASGRAFAIRTLESAEPSFLRFPLVARDDSLKPSARLGAVRGYPRLLDEEVALRGIVQRGAERLTGALELRDRLITLPAHGMLRDKDFDAIRRWLRD